MSVLYLVAKDIENLDNRLTQLEQKSAESQASLSCGCGEWESTEFVDEGTLTLESGLTVRVKTATFGRRRNNDCEWRSETISLYSNGDYRDRYDIYDHGSIWGDTFTTYIKIHVGSADISGWSWKKTLDARQNFVGTKNGHDDRIAQLFDSITSVGRNRNCQSEAPL